jgi:hypothetical protein
MRMAIIDNEDESSDGGSCSNPGLAKVAGIGGKDLALEFTTPSITLFLTLPNIMQFVRQAGTILEPMIDCNKSIILTLEDYVSIVQQKFRKKKKKQRL